MVLAVPAGLEPVTVDNMGRKVLAGDAGSGSLKILNLTRA
jgi:hypothetical protein